MGRRESRKQRRQDEFDKNYTIQYILKEYDLVLESYECFNSVYRVVTNRGVKALKPVLFESERAHFIYAVMEHLAAKGYKNCVRLLKTKHNQVFATAPNGDAYYLTDWVQGKTCSLFRQEHLEALVTNLAVVHDLACDFEPPSTAKHYHNFGKWPHKLHFRGQQLFEWTESLGDRRDHNRFERLYLDAAEHFYRQAQIAVQQLQRPEYRNLVQREQEAKVFCLREYNSSNVVRERDKILLVDVDCSLQDLRIYDLARLILRVASLTHWDWNLSDKMLKAYDSRRPISKEEKLVLVALLTFPRRFYLYAQRYFEQQEFDQNELLHQLKRTIKDEPQRLEFLKMLQTFAVN